MVANPQKFSQGRMNMRCGQNHTTSVDHDPNDVRNTLYELIPPAFAPTSKMKYIDPNGAQYVAT